MMFTVINKDGRTVMRTEFPSCIPDKEQIDSMIKAGYKFKNEGKVISKTQIEELRNIDKHTD